MTNKYRPLENSDSDLHIAPANL